MRKYLIKVGDSFVSEFHDCLLEYPRREIKCDTNMAKIFTNKDIAEEVSILVNGKVIEV